MNKYSDCFRCHCGCNGLPEGGMNQKLVDLLNDMGVVDDDVNSGYRCPDHNESVGGSKNSQHVQGTACDINATRFGSVEELASTCESLGADGVGRYYEENFVHADCRDGRVWGSYRW